MNLIFWAHSPSQQILPFLSSLSSNSDCKVTMVVDYLLSEARSSMGWEIPEKSPGVDIILAPTEKEITDLVNNSPTGSYHVFSGFNNSKRMSIGFRAAIKNKAVRIGILAEPFNWTGFFGELRFLRSVLRRVRHGKRIDLFLAIGNKGIEMYRKSGFSTSKLFPFAYVALPVDICTATSENTDKYKILFSGSLIRRKGVDILLRALCGIRDDDIEVNIVGDGGEKLRLMTFVKNEKLDFVNFHPFKKYKELIKFMGEHDLLILPSRRDGWGSVINESLFTGTPVIASSHCGASAILGFENGGAVFHSGNYEELAALIKQRIDKGKIKAQERVEIKRWSEKIGPDSLAEYFLKIVAYIEKGGDRPLPPW